MFTVTPDEGSTKMSRMMNGSKTTRIIRNDAVMRVHVTQTTLPPQITAGNASDKASAVVPYATPRHNSLTPIDEDDDAEEESALKKKAHHGADFAPAAAVTAAVGGGEADAQVSAVVRSRSVVLMRAFVRARASRSLSERPGQACVDSLGGRLWMGLLPLPAPAGD
jgi:hypothetical protein